MLKSDWVKSNVTKFVDIYGGNKTKPVLREAPPLLELEEHEKFRDEDGNVYEVEVRGVREEDKIYFRGRDIEKLFEMERLIDIVKQENTYTLVQDYEMFLLVQNTGNMCFGPVENQLNEHFSRIMVYSRSSFVLTQEQLIVSANGRPR